MHSKEPHFPSTTIYSTTHAGRAMQMNNNCCSATSLHRDEASFFFFPSPFSLGNMTAPRKRLARFSRESKYGNRITETEDQLSTFELHERRLLGLDAGEGGGALHQEAPHEESLQRGNTMQQVIIRTNTSLLCPFSKLIFFFFFLFLFP